MLRLYESDAITNTRSDEYDEYLKSHINNVIRSWNEILKPKLLEFGDFDLGLLDNLDDITYNHDKSKFSQSEYDAYANYFYPEDDTADTDIVNTKFDLAWLHHQNHNPHHWQYYVLIKDGGELAVLDMDLASIFEMLCDWHSFSAKDPKSTAYKWYQDNKEKMMLSAATRETVEKYIDLFIDPLN